MSRRDPKLPFFQIREHVKEIIEISEGKSREDLDQDRIYNLAITRLIEIIGEAANRVSIEFQSKYSQIPWMQMISARNRLIHGYDSVDFNILWVIVHEDMPNLLKQIEEVIKVEGWENINNQ